MPRTRRAAGALAALFVLSLALVAAVLVMQGYHAYIVRTGSMSPTYRPGDVVLDSRPRAVRPGDVITFLHSHAAGDVVTHRVTGVSDGLIHTKGDANATADVWRIRPDQVRGVVVGAVPKLGFLLVFFRQTTGVAATMTCVLSIALLWGIFFPPLTSGEAVARSTDGQAGSRVDREVAASAA